MKFIRRNFADFLEELDYKSIDDPAKSLKKKIGNRLGIRELCGFRKTDDLPREWDAPFSNF